MIERIRQGWRDLRQGEPGRRFRSRYERRRQQGRRSIARKWSVIALGVLITLAGVVFLPLPGPGMLIIAFGLLLMAEESRGVAQALDAAELRARALLARTSRRRRPPERYGSR